MDAYEAVLSSDKTKLYRIVITNPTDSLTHDIINCHRYKNFPANQFVMNCLRNNHFLIISCYKDGYCLSDFIKLECTYKRLLIKHYKPVKVVIYALECMKIPTTVIGLLKQFLKIAKNKNISIYTKQTNKKLVKITPVKVKIHYGRFEYICSNEMTDEQLEELFKEYKNKKYKYKPILKECEFPDEEECPN